MRWQNAPAELHIPHSGCLPRESAKPWLVLETMLKSYPSSLFHGQEKLKLGAPNVFSKAGASPDCFLEVHIPLSPAVCRKSTPAKHQEPGCSLTLKCKPASLFNFICISKLCGRGGWEAASPSTGAVLLVVSGVPPWSQMAFHACSA